MFAWCKKLLINSIIQTQNELVNNTLVRTAQRPILRPGGPLGETKDRQSTLTVRDAKIVAYRSL